MKSYMMKCAASFAVSFLVVVSIVVNLNPVPKATRPQYIVVDEYAELLVLEAKHHLNQLTGVCIRLAVKDGIAPDSVCNIPR